MKVAILGFGLEGKSALRYYSELGAEVTVCDQNLNTQLPEGIKSHLGPEYLQGLAAFDIIFRTPGLAPKHILVASPGIESKITTGLNEFLRVCPSKNTIGVTGTKGKGTTSTLIAHMLQGVGKRVHLGGNIGVPPLDLLKMDILPDDYVVLELSSFQLIDLQTSPHIAVCLMVVAEHLDWHTDMQEYLISKQQLFVHQLPDDITVFYAENDNSRVISSAGQAKKIPYTIPPGAVIEDGLISIDGQIICRTSEIKLLGEHNWQNVCAAITTVWQISQDVVAMHKVISNFSGLPYRIEFRVTKNDITYYNDSFASAPPAPIAAMQAVHGPKVMIIGGFDRGLDLSDLISGIVKEKANLRTVMLIGASGPKVFKALEAAGMQNITLSTAKTMQEIVAQATGLAQKGDAVVLSPGFASFDMFKNFEDRGQQFNVAVDAL
jgi:UDP-N-acetylmuramoylalanine--D-glutamate ligase